MSERLGRLRTWGIDVMRSMRHLTEWMLHASRHREARDRLRRLRRPRTILVVCYGNICRSPYLEALLKRALPDIRVSSAGFVGPGRTVPEHSVTVAARRGIDLSAHRSRPLTRDGIAGADLIVVMEERQARLLRRAFGGVASRIVVAGDLDPESGEGRTIRDPWNQPVEVFESSFARLDRCADSLVTELNGRPPA